MGTPDFDRFMRNLDLLEEFIAEEAEAVFDPEDILLDFIERYPHIDLDYAWDLYDELRKEEM